MRMHIAVLTAALALAAGCNKGPDEAKPSSGASAPPAQASTPNMPNTPANAGQPSAQEKKDGANPVQGQVDPKQGEQHRDFRQDGDAAGPKSTDAAPKTGG